VTRAATAVLLSVVFHPVGLLGQHAPPPSVVIAHATPKAVASAMGEILKPQKFKVTKAGSGRIVVSQKRGDVAQATGEILKVRLEMGFALEPVGDSLRVTATDETYYADRGTFGEQKRSVEVEKERESFENLLRMVKARVDSMTADTTGAS